jgi:hypothetical protein
MLSIGRLMAAACLAALASAAQAQEAAIARCLATGAVSVGKGPSLSAAGADAAQNCEENGGERFCCQIVIDTQRSDCIAYARNEVGEGAGGGFSPDEAKYNAVMACGYNDCRPLAALCKY